MDRKGFTLIELLAVILILGVVALIAIPSVNAVIIESKKGSFEVSSNNIVKDLKNQCTASMIAGEQMKGTYYIVDGKVDNLELEINGKLPSSGQFTFDKDCNIEYYAESDDQKFVVAKDFIDDRVTVYDKENSSSETAKFLAPTINETGENSCFLFENNSTGVTITGYKYEDESCSRNIVIPTSINDRHVTKIKDFAFSYKNPLILYELFPDEIAYDYSHKTSVYVYDSSLEYDDSRLFLYVLPEGTTIEGTNCFDASDNKTFFDYTYVKTDSDGFDYCLYVLNDENQVESDIEIESLDFSSAKYLTVIPRAVARNAKIQRLVLGNFVREIKSTAFFNNNITEIEIPSQLETIGAGALGFNSIQSLDLKNVKSIGVISFYHNAISELKLSNLTLIPRSSFDSNYIVNLKIPDSVKFIDDNAFFANDIDKLVLGKGVEGIGVYAFAGAKNRKQINELTLNQGLKRIGGLSFSAANIKKLVIPSSVEIVGGAAFKGATLLEEVVIEDGVKSIGKEIFSGCSKLKELNFPGSVTNIPYFVCYNCPALETVTFAEGVKDIGQDAFRGGIIKEINLPSSIVTLNGNAFRYLKQLETININKPSGSVKKSPWGAGSTVTINWLG